MPDRMLSTAVTIMMNVTTTAGSYVRTVTVRQGTSDIVTSLADERYRRRTGALSWISSP